jgi:hypothetical protein
MRDEIGATHPNPTNVLGLPLFLLSVIDLPVVFLNSKRNFITCSIF